MSYMIIVRSLARDFQLLSKPKWNTKGDEIGAECIQFVMVFIIPWFVHVDRVIVSKTHVCLFGAPTS
jgi:hypothetical protein